MPVKVCFVHTVSGLAQMFKDMCAELMPETELCHISDESIIQRILAAEGLTPAVYRRTCEHVVAAEQAGADVVQFTCSSISPCADVAGHLVSLPVLKIDEPMVREAVREYGRIGVIATNPGTLKPSTQLVEDIAEETGRDVETVSVLCEGAYPAWFAGDHEKHDRIVRHHLLDLMSKVEVVCLAQASMSRIAEGMSDAERTVPVLSSPGPAMERLADVVADLRDDLDA